MFGHTPHDALKVGGHRASDPNQKVDFGNPTATAVDPTHASLADHHCRSCRANPVGCTGVMQVFAVVSTGVGSVMKSAAHMEKLGNPKLYCENLLSVGAQDE